MSRIGCFFCQELFFGNDWSILAKMRWFFQQLGIFTENWVFFGINWVIFGNNSVFWQELGTFCQQLGFLVGIRYFAKN